MPLCGATMDENDRPPLDEGGLQGGGWCLEVRRPPPDPLLVQGGVRHFQRRQDMVVNLGSSKYNSEFV
jgi:hypothetical protein